MDLSHNQRVIVKYLNNVWNMKPTTKEIAHALEWTDSRVAAILRRLEKRNIVYRLEGNSPAKWQLTNVARWAYKDDSRST